MGGPHAFIHRTSTFTCCVIFDSQSRYIVLNQNRPFFALHNSYKTKFVFVHPSSISGTSDEKGGLILQFVFSFTEYDYSIYLSLLK